MIWDRKKRSQGKLIGGKKGEGKRKKKKKSGSRRGDKCRANQS
jgi:hypothetical protein